MNFVDHALKVNNIVAGTRLPGNCCYYQTYDCNLTLFDVLKSFFESNSLFNSARHSIIHVQNSIFLFSQETHVS